MKLKHKITIYRRAQNHKERLPIFLLVKENKGQLAFNYLISNTSE